MPAVSGRGGRRRTINEINMVPFIDVMLVLLIIFMVTAPLITTGVVDLPTVGRAARAAERHVVEITVGADETLRLKVDGKEGDRATFADLGRKVVQAQAGDAATPVVIAADKGVRYELVVRAMDVLNRAGVKRVGLAVKSGVSSG